VAATVSIGPGPGDKLEANSVPAPAGRAGPGGPAPVWRERHGPERNLRRYGGSAHSFGFAIYSAARARYEDAVLLTGSPVGTPQEALDTACTVHLAGSETNPRRINGATHLSIRTGSR
jgi:hypothetical protein